MYSSEWKLFLYSFRYKSQANSGYEGYTLILTNYLQFQKNEDKRELKDSVK